MTLTRPFLAAAAALLIALPACAHHSNSMFDHDTTVTLTGTVKDFQFTNPHCWIQLLVKTDGDPVEWSIEMGAPAHLLRSGWKPHTLRPGDKITVIINPLRDGGKGGNYVSVGGPGGNPIGQKP
jgi:hypothetical protein